MLRLVSALALALCSGACTVVADVDYRRVDDAPSQDFAFNGTVNFSFEHYEDPSAAYASELDVELGVDFPMRIVFRTNDLAWAAEQPEGLTMCEDASLQAAVTDMSPGLGRRLMQVVGGTGSLCLGEVGLGDDIGFSASRSGPPPPGQEAYLPSSMMAQLYLSGQLQSADDGSEEQPALPSSLALTSGTFEHHVYDGSLLLSSVRGSFTGTVDALP